MCIVPCDRLLVVVVQGRLAGTLGLCWGHLQVGDSRWQVHTVSWWCIQAASLIRTLPLHAHCSAESVPERELYSRACCAGSVNFLCLQVHRHGYNLPTYLQGCPVLGAVSLVTHTGGALADDAHILSTLILCSTIQQTQQSARLRGFHI
jgi:hypothetical protein